MIRNRNTEYKDDEMVAEHMLASDIPYLHAIVIANSFSDILNFDARYIGNVAKNWNL